MFGLGGGRDQRPAYVQHNQATGAVYAVQHGDQFNWSFEGSPAYRIEPFASSRPRLTPEVAARWPSRLLDARYGIVPFLGRTTELADLDRWLTSAAPAAYRLITGSGGEGKTRLAHEFAARHADRWAVALPRHRLHQSLGKFEAPQLTAADGGLLLVVDYAERWPVSDLLDLLNVHSRIERLRVLFLARTDIGWWDDVEQAIGDLGVVANHVPLAPLGSQVGPASLQGEALEAFVPQVQGAVADRVQLPPARDVGAAGFVLTILMGVLAAVLASAEGEAAPHTPAEVPAYLLRRERSGWREFIEGHSELRVSAAQLSRAVFVAGLVPSVPYAVAVEALVRAAVAAGEADAAEVVTAHGRAYPPAAGGQVLTPLAPDRLAEDFLALSVIEGADRELFDPWGEEAIRHLLVERDTNGGSSASAAAPGEGMPPWTVSAMTLIAEASARWPALATTTLNPLLLAKPALAVAAGGAALARIAALETTDVTLLEALTDALPSHSHVDLDIAAALVAERHVHLAVQETTPPAERARLLATLGYRLRNAGRREEALAPTEEAVTLYRALAKANPAAYAPNLAMALNNLGALLSALGRREEALAPTEEAVTLRRALAKANPAAYTPDLAMALNNLGALLSELGRREEALAPTEEAATLYRALANANPAAHTPDLAMALNNLGIRLSALGRREEALAPTEEAATLYRALAKANPAAYTPDLATSLNNLGIRLSALGRRDEALAPTEEAATLYRALATANPAAYTPNLAGALNNLGILLSELGRREEALAPTEEAATLRRALVKANPAAYTPDLANSLWAIGWICDHLQIEHERGLAACAEAITLLEPLAAAYPQRFGDLLEAVNATHASLAGRAPVSD